MTRTQRLSLIGGLYLAQGLPYGFFTQVVPVLLRQAGVSLGLVGAAHLLALPWALKFLAGPWADARAARNGGHRRKVVLGLQLAAVCVLASLAIAPQSGALAIMLGAVLVLNAIAALQDVETDAIAVELLPADERGLGNGLQVAAYRVGMIVGGGAMLLVADHLGAAAAFGLMAVVVGVTTLPLLVWGGRDVPRAREIERVTLRGWFGQPGAWRWFVVLVTFKAGEALAGGMLRPWLVDRGVGLTELAWLLGTVGFGAGLAGAFAGGALAVKASARVVLAIAGTLQALGIAAIGLAAGGLVDVAPAVAFEHFASGLATASLFTHMMGRCRPGAAATDYTLQASAVVAATGASAAVSGLIAAQVGHGGLFAIAAGLAVVGTGLVAWVLRSPSERLDRAVAVYAGSFDPVTEGHLGIVRQAARLCRRVEVLVAVNPAKACLFTPEERVELVRGEVAGLANVSVDFTEGLVVDHARRIGATVLIRGIRGATDAEAETELARQNRLLAPEIATIFLPAFEALAEVSSSRLKELVRRGADTRRWCSDRVAARIRVKLASLREAA